MKIDFLNGMTDTGSYSWDYGDECPSCHCHHPYLQKDHIIPKGEGGTNSSDNIQYVCPNCHSIKTHDDISRASSKYWATEEAKQKQSRNSRGNQRAKGYKHTEETREHLSKTLKGKPKPEGHGQHVSEATKGKAKSEAHRQRITEAQARPEVKAKQSEAKRGNTWNKGRVSPESDEELAKLQRAIDELEKKLGL